MSESIKIGLGEEVNVSLINTAIELALAPGVALPSRSSIDAYTQQLNTHLRALMSVVDVRSEHRPDVRALSRVANQLIALENRPTVETPQYTAWDHIRNMATITAAYRDVYLKQCPSSRP